MLTEVSNKELENFVKMVEEYMHHDKHSRVELLDTLDDILKQTTGQGLPNQTRKVVLNNPEPNFATWIQDYSYVVRFELNKRKETEDGKTGS